MAKFKSTGTKINSNLSAFQNAAKSALQTENKG